jgi:predicted short-subunit dehydrogenase-like oxidoreductase (DUF2520 family)
MSGRGPAPARGGAPVGRPPRPPLRGLRLALVGPGKVGSSVARWLLARGATLAVVARQSAATLPRWASAAGAHAAALDELTTADCDLLLIAAPDAAMEALATALAARPQAPVVLHTSGLLTADALAPLRRAGSAVGGLHPLRAFPRPLPAPSLASRTFFALQGDDAALAMARRIAEALGAPHAEVPGPARALYHLAATWAAGGAVTLLGTAVDLHARAGVDAAAAPGLGELARGALAAVADPARPVASLSGPLARGEPTYLAQLAALREASPALHPLAVLLALEGLRQLAARDPLSQSQEALRSALREICAQPSFLDPLRERV